MAKELKQWIEEDVKPLINKDFGWLSSQFFLRDPKRPNYFDRDYFFSPADGVIIYQNLVKPNEPLVEIKGVNYNLKQAFQDEDFEQECYVIGIYMTFYNVHINRIPYSGLVSYQELIPIKSKNLPMINEENKLLEEIIDFSEAEYMHTNQRIINSIYSSKLKQFYYILQMADFDVNCIIPFKREQNRKFHQNERFSIVRWGSQVDLIIPKSKIFNFEFLLKPGMVVEAGLDKLIKIIPNEA
jgi:phosphatidylserine decarboxylase